MEVNEDQAAKVNTVLRSYENGTGQLINPAKCSMFFSNACTDDDKESVRSILAVQSIAQEEKYLGLRTPDGVNASQAGVSDTCQGGAKEVLMKSVCQAIPTYVMGVFKLPGNLCEELNQMIRYFWWGEEDGQHKVH
jgi:hypothetical protein